MNEKLENSKSRDQKDDYALIKAFQNGENAAFDALVLRYKDRVFNLCLRFLGDYNEAEDIAQDVFVKAYNSLIKFRFESSFFTWLYRISVNSCKNRIKSLEFRFRKSDARIDISDDALQSLERENIADRPLNPASELENKETMKILQKAINSLPSDQKAVVILRDIQGLSYEEITDITGFKLGTLKSRLSRARNSLREKLGDIL
jgi:RNA polymerase sigma-70 factor (ECF subfamily)